MSGAERAGAGHGWRAWLATDAPASRRQARLGEAYRFACAAARHPSALVGLAIVLLLALAAALAPLLAPYAPSVQHLADRLQGPSARHWLGTDELGRDILSRLIYGARLTLGIVALVTAISAPLGLAIGCIAGYAGHWIDAALMRVTDVCLTLPRLILALAFVAALGPGVENAVLAIALVAWPPYARLARAETLAFRRSDFIAAARLAGASPGRIVLRHIMPLCLPSVIVRVSLDMAGVILIAAGLGFLGLGAQPPAPEWGAMIAAGRKYMLDQWWVAAMPGIAIAAVSLGFTLLGDGLRDMLDPKQR
jgi:peptide/nickel transport system permease protein